MTEFGFIDHIAALFGDLPLNSFEGIGDDCAVIEIGGGESLLFTADLVCEDVHFLRSASSAFDVGYKSLAVNLSDVAAMGARPVATLLSVSLPKDATEEWAEEFMRGYHALSKRYGVALVGGDTTRSASRITINVTAIGRMATSKIKRRSAAREGDVIFAGDVLGASGGGLNDILRGLPDTRLADLHRRPEPQIEEGLWLAEREEVHAMMDISDGLASDIRHIMEQSHVGAELDLGRIPVAEGVNLKTAATGGEDYKLLFTADPDRAKELMRDFENHFHRPIHPVGRITRGDKLRWMRNGEAVELDWHGFTHY